MVGPPRLLRGALQQSGAVALLRVHTRAGLLNRAPWWSAAPRPASAPRRPCCPLPPTLATPPTQPGPPGEQEPRGAAAGGGGRALRQAAGRRQGAAARRGQPGPEDRGGGCALAVLRLRWSGLPAGLRWAEWQACPVGWLGVDDDAADEALTVMLLWSGCCERVAFTKPTHLSLRCGPLRAPAQSCPPRRRAPWWPQPRPSWWRACAQRWGEGGRRGWRAAGPWLRRFASSVLPPRCKEV